MANLDLMVCGVSAVGFKYKKQLYSNKDVKKKRNGKVEKLDFISVNYAFRNFQENRDTSSVVIELMPKPHKTATQICGKERKQHRNH